MRAFLLSLLVASTLAALATPARADDNADLIKARKELDGLQYDRARVSLERALSAGTSSPGQLAEIYLLSGQVAASLGNSTLAEDHFKRLLALQPEARLTSGVSPKITGPFESAQKWMAGRAPLRVTHVVSQDGEPAVALTVESDPLEMVAAARATYKTADGREGIAEAGGTAPFVLAFPGGDALAITATVVDRYGNRLVEIELSLAAKTDKIVDEPRRASPPLYARWWLWGGFGLAFAGGATYFGLDAMAASDELDALNRDSMNHDFSEARAIEDRGRQSALVANIGFGVAGACAVAAAWLFVADVGGGGGPAEHATFVPLEGGGGAFVVSGSF